jgi:two-component system, NarL family, nitrate/nitrite response regulator NarL
MAGILVVEDHAVLSGAMAESLRAHGFGEVHVADPDDLGRESVLSLAERLRPDLVLLDLFLGGDHSGLPLVAPLVELGARVVILSSSQDRALLARCLQAGAVGLLDKAMRFDALVDSVRKAAAGESLVDESQRAELLAGLSRQEEEERARLAPFEQLTSSEREVLAMLLEGTAPKQIARSRGVSLATVRNQVRAVLAKLGVSSEREALALVREVGWTHRRSGRFE